MGSTPHLLERARRSYAGQHGEQLRVGTDVSIRSEARTAASMSQVKACMHRR